MLLSKKAAALAAGVLAAVVARRRSAQEPGRPAGLGRRRQIVVDGSIDWVEKSDVVGPQGWRDRAHRVRGRPHRRRRGSEIGYLHDEMAELTEAKAKLAAANVGEIEKAKAQKELALAQNARIMRLEKKRARHRVASDEKDKAEAELAVANAVLIERQGRPEARQGRLRPGRRSAQGAQDHRPVRRRRSPTA